MSESVIIPTAGLGSRMGNFTKNLNKALLPYKDKPVLGHIIDAFPRDTKFIIPVGYTLKQCRHHVTGAFWYVPCDTYFDETIVDKVSNNDCYFVKSVPEKDTHLYTMFDVGLDLTIREVVFKNTTPDTWCAFTGLMYVHNSEQFWQDLDQLNSNEFIYIIRRGSDTRELNTWLDFGSPEIYQTELSKSQKFDFSKKDEVTYIVNDRVVKWWLDPGVAEKKYRKAVVNVGVFPPNVTHSGNYMAYDFWPGKTLYEFNNPIAFSELLEWMERNVWQDYEVSVESAALEFYKTKSLSRIAKFLEKYPNLSPVTTVDGVAVKDYQYYLDNIDWEYLSKTCRPGFMHGDLQFDNIVINSAGEFKLIDWRHEFAGIVEYGDIYYDLAKMAGGFIINYANIKNHNFNIEIDDQAVTLSVPNVDHITVYQRKLKEYVLANDLDYKKVQQLVPIIFWNMAPLHTAPFDIFLWYLGMKLFAELDNE
jgi:thiamine kinase-like enzyme